ncbi:MAG: hypothetical protein QM647_17455 [Asticcacaulis sp.]|uniref:hypothetical protein n=1 Tax=Asticcacaulis sp. TaxID=1872648 RepID=UPI0039E3DF30
MNALAIPGLLLLIAGLLTVFTTWRHKGTRTGIWRYGLPGGWALIIAGMAIWAFSTHPDQGLALGSVTLMILAGGILAWQGLKLAGKPAKTQIERESATDTIALGKGYWGRFAVRLVGSLLVVPAVSIMLGIFWQAYMPVSAADGLVGAAIAAILIMGAALTWQLASRHPYRTCSLLTGLAAITAVAVYLPLLLGKGA